MNTPRFRAGTVTRLAWKLSVSPSWPKPSKPPGRGRSQKPLAQPAIPGPERRVTVRKAWAVPGLNTVVPSRVPPARTSCMKRAMSPAVDEAETAGAIWLMYS